MKLRKKLPDNSIWEAKLNEPPLIMPDNKIRTYKFSALNFIPKILFYEFSKMANLYFLVIFDFPIQFSLLSVV